MFIFLIIVIGVIDAVSSTMLRSWADSGKVYLLILGVIGFALAGLLFGYSMHYKGLAIANILWIGLSALSLTLIALIFFKEHLNALQIAGMITVFVGFVLLNLK